MEGPAYSPAVRGRQIGSYTLESVIGAGAFGAVHRAWHSVLARPVALKLLHAARSHDAQVVERFLREARLAASLQSPHIVQVLDAGVTSEQEYFLAMELLEGETLEARLAREGPMPPRAATTILRQVLEGAEAAHAAGFVHRDLKPANVFLAWTPGQTEPVAKVLDFGISKSRRADAGQTLTETGAMLGTPLYMAPEQFDGAHDVDARADLYACTVMLYRMLSGHLPHEASTYEGLLAARLTEGPVPITRWLPGLAPAWVAIIDRGLARAPSDRFPSARALDAALGAALEATEPEASSKPTRGPSSPGTERVYDETIAEAGAGGAASTRDRGRAAAAASGRSIPSPTPASHPNAAQAARSPWLWIGLAAFAVAAALLTLTLLAALAGGIGVALWSQSTSHDDHAPQQGEGAPSAVPPEVYVVTMMGGEDPVAMNSLIAVARDGIGRCAAPPGAEVRVQLHLGPAGEIRLAQPDPTAPSGPTSTALCVAQALRAAAPPGGLGGAGIAVIAARFPAR